MIYINDDPKLGHVSFVLTESKVLGPEELTNPENNFHVIDNYRYANKAGANYYGYSHAGYTIRSCIPMKDLSEHVLDHSFRTLDVIVRGGTYVEFFGDKITRRYNSEVPYTWYSVPYVYLSREADERYIAGRAFYDTMSGCFIDRTKVRVEDYTIGGRKSTAVKQSKFVVEKDGNIPEIIKILQNPNYWEINDFNAITFKDTLMGSVETRENVFFRILRLAEYFYDSHVTSMAGVTLGCLYDRQSVPYKRFNRLPQYKLMSAEEVLLGFAVTGVIERRIIPYYVKHKNYKP